MIDYQVGYQSFKKVHEDLKVKEQSGVCYSAGLVVVSNFEGMYRNTNTYWMTATPSLRIIASLPMNHHSNQSTTGFVMSAVRTKCPAVPKKWWAGAPKRFFSK